VSQAVPALPAQQHHGEQVIAFTLEHDAHVCLVNTGWGTGASGAGRRISLTRPRAIVGAIHSGALAKARTERDPICGVDVPTKCPAVPPEILAPRGARADASAYDATAQKRAGLFREHFKKYEAGGDAEIKAAGPA
jgi:phosphoenolpyruvate carboxykinase (ATP)